MVPPLLRWFAAHARDLPWRRTRDPYAIWIAEIMLQQTQVKTVLPFWQRWMRALPDIRRLADAPAERIHKLWEGLGYYHRARNLQKAAQIVVHEHHGQFPKNFETVLALPGIGRYTAGAICSIAFNQPRPILDGNVIRVVSRLFGIRGNPRESTTNAELWRIAEEFVLEAARREQRFKPKSARTIRFTLAAKSKTEAEPQSNRLCSALNQALMELGALLCTPKRPRCEVCPLVRFCVAREQGWTAQLPNLARRVAPIRRRFVAVVLENRGRFLVRQRPPGGVNAYLWEFPNIEVLQKNCSPRRAARELVGDSRIPLLPLRTIRHSITRYRITLDVFRGSSSFPRHGGPRGKWLNRHQLNRVAFASAHKRVLASL
jgi:A/G-specific adenine glycosylase